MVVPQQRDQWSWQTSISFDSNELQYLVVDYKTKEVLLGKEAGKWVLPGGLFRRSVLRSSVEPFVMISLFHQLMESSMPVVFLRRLWHVTHFGDYNNISKEFEKSVVLMELSDAKCRQRGLEWVSLKKANVFHLFKEAQNALLNEIRLAMMGTEPINRLAWERRSWFHSTSSWMRQRLMLQCSATVKGSIVFLRASQLSCILQADTDSGTFYLKRTSLTNDAALTECLSQIVPKYVAKPVVVCTKERTMITAKYGSVLCPWEFSRMEKERLYSDYAELQKATIGKTEQLLNAGFPDFRPSRLLLLIDKIGQHKMFGELECGDFSSDVKYFLEHTNVCKKIVQALIETNIPATVAHNDFYSSNVYKSALSNHYMFFDWVDGHVSHPFCSKGIFSKHGYYQQWQTYGTLEQLKLWHDVGSGLYPLTSLKLRLDEAASVESCYVGEALSEAGNNLSDLVCYMQSWTSSN